MKFLYKKTAGLIKDAPGFNWIGKDLKQIDVYDTKPSVALPCALIKVSLVQCESIGAGRQLCKANVTIRMAFDLIVSETSTKAPEAALERSLSYLDNVDWVFRTLQGYTDHEVEEYDRKNEIEEERQDNLTVVRLVFSTSYIDEPDNV